MNELTNQKIAALRVDYCLKAFDESEVLENPMLQFEHWIKEAIEAEVNEPNAMTIATVNPNGTPSARVVLLKGFTQNGFTFFTNYDSHKGQQLIGNPNIAVVFCWLELQRQVRIEGTVTKLSNQENDEYFYSRPLDSQIGALASPQSKIIPSRMVLEQNFEKVKNNLSNQKIMRPENWGGFFINPNKVEFWQGRSSRLHDRFEFTKDGSNWKHNRLAP